MPSPLGRVREIRYQSVRTKRSGPWEASGFWGAEGHLVPEPLHPTLLEWVWRRMWPRSRIAGPRRALPSSAELAKSR